MASWNKRITQAKERGFFSLRDEQDVQNEYTDSLGDLLNRYGFDYPEHKRLELRQKLRDQSERFVKAVFESNITEAERIFNEENAILSGKPAKIAIPEVISPKKTIIQAPKLTVEPQKLALEAPKMIGTDITFDFDAKKYNMKSIEPAEPVKTSGRIENLTITRKVTQYIRSLMREKKAEETNEGVGWKEKGKDYSKKSEKKEFVPLEQVSFNGFAYGLSYRNRFKRGSVEAGLLSILDRAATTERPISITADASGVLYVKVGRETEYEYYHGSTEKEALEYAKKQRLEGSVRPLEELLRVKA